MKYILKSDAKKLNSILMNKPSFLLLMFVFTVFISTDNYAQDGSIDTTFVSGTGFNYSGVQAIAMQSDGKIIVGGDFSQYNGSAHNKLIRLNTDGTFDPTFNTGTGPDTSVTAIGIQSSGKVLVSGYFENVNGIAKKNFVQLKSDGSIDHTFQNIDKAHENIVVITNDNFLLGGPPFSKKFWQGGNYGTFTSGLSTFSKTECISVQDDGKIIIGGTFTQYSGQNRNKIARLDPSGILDINFDVGSGASNTVYTSAIQKDGKVIIGGRFTSYNGKTAKYIARLDSNGSLDTSFNLGAGLNGNVVKVLIQKDQKIIVSGNFTKYNDISVSKLIRLNTNGTLDTTFSNGTGPNDPFTKLILQNDGNIIAGGDHYLTSYDGKPIGNLVRILATSITEPVCVGPNLNSTLKISTTIDCAKPRTLLQVTEGDSVGMMWFKNKDHTELYAAAGTAVIENNVPDSVWLSMYGTYSIVQGPNTALGVVGSKTDTAIFTTSTGTIIRNYEIYFPVVTGLKTDTVVTRIVNSANQELYTNSQVIQEGQIYQSKPFVFLPKGEYKIILDQGQISASDNSAIPNQQINSFVNYSKNNSFFNIKFRTKDTTKCFTDTVIVIANSCVVTKIDKQENTLISIFPNPSKGNFSVKSSSSIDELTVYDQSGRVVKTLNTANNHVTQVQLGTNGVYYIHVKSNETYKVFKAIVVN